MNFRPERGRPARKPPGARASRPQRPRPRTGARNSPSPRPAPGRCGPEGRAPLGAQLRPLHHPLSYFLLPTFYVLFFPLALLAADPVRPSVTPVAPSLPDVSFSVLRVFGALALVFALFLGAVWLFRNWQRLTLNRGRPSKLNVLEVRALGQRHAIYVIGYQQQRVLVGTSPGGVSLLSHLPDDDSPPEAQPRAATFSEIWQHLRERKP